MTELKSDAPSTCCTSQLQSTCCESDDKSACCDSEGSCGCVSGTTADRRAFDVHEEVRKRYAAAAANARSGRDAGCGGGDLPSETDSAVFGRSRYTLDERATIPEAASLASLGCGNPTAVAELRDGETVLDLGSGGGLDVFLSAKRVGPSGRVYGLDMTDEMLALARENQARAGVSNVEWLKGTIEEIPLPDESVDVVISNCVINLSGEKERTLAEAARVLRPGGRFAVSDVIADPDMDVETRRDLELWTGCVAGALTEPEFRGTLDWVGLSEVDVQETHRVHRHAASAIVRARKPRR